jgi:hypothetical protein
MDTFSDPKSNLKGVAHGIPKVINLFHLSSLLFYYQLKNEKIYNKISSENHIKVMEVTCKA